MSLIAILTAAPTAFAQNASKTVPAIAPTDSITDYWIDEGGSPACMASIPQSEMHRESFFIDALMPPHTPASLTSQADFMASEVATELRRMLGSDNEQVPSGDSAVTWYGASSELVVTAHPDGSVTRRFIHPAADSSAGRLLYGAFDAARARGTAMMLWPDGFAADSLTVRLSLSSIAALTPKTIIARRGQPVRFAVFTISVPTRTPALPRTTRDGADYPMRNQMRGVSGTLTLQFVVDTSGRAEPATIHDLWPRDLPRLSGESARYYQDFVTSSTGYVKHLKFEPSRIGGCAVRQLVLQPMRFVKNKAAFNRMQAGAPRD